jgi:hypothetical protein
VDKRLDGVPGQSGEPLERVFHTRLGETFQEEVHLGVLVADIDDFLLHETEGQQTEENQFVAFEESTHHPLANAVADSANHFFNTGFVLDSHLSDSLSEENIEGIQRVLVHMVDHIQRDDQEVQHGAFGGHRAIDFALLVNLDFGLAGNFGLGLDFLRSLLSDIQLLNQGLVVQDRCGIGFGQGLQQFFLESVHGDLEVI